MTYIKVSMKTSKTASETNSNVCVQCVYLDPDFMNLRRGNIHFFNRKRLPGLPSNSCHASDYLEKIKYAN